MCCHVFPFPDPAAALSPWKRTPKVSSVLLRARGQVVSGCHEHGRQPPSPRELCVLPRMRTAPVSPAALGGLSAGLASRQKLAAFRESCSPRDSSALVSGTFLEMRMWLSLGSRRSGPTPGLATDPLCDPGKVTSSLHLVLPSLRRKGAGTTLRQAVSFHLGKVLRCCGGISVPSQHLPHHALLLVLVPPSVSPYLSGRADKRQGQ